MKSNWRGQYTRYKSYMLNTVTQYKERQDVKTYLEILLSLATVSAFAIFALRPTLLTIAGLLKDIQSKEETIATMDAKTEDLAQANSLYTSYKEKIVLLSESIPDESEPEVLIRQLEGLVAKHPASVNSVGIDNVLLVGKQIASPQAPTRNAKNTSTFPANATPVAFSINFTGNYSVLADLISDLEKMRRPTSIDTLNFTLKQQKNEEDQLILTINGRVPYSSIDK